VPARYQPLPDGRGSEVLLDRSHTDVESALASRGRLGHTPRVRPHDLDALEYPRVLERLAALAQSDAGAAACRALRPQTDPTRVREALAQTWQLFRLRDGGAALPGTAVPDVAEHLKTAAHEGFVLDGTRLVHLRQVLTAGRELATFLRRHRDALPALARLSEQLAPPSEVEQVLARALDDDGVVRDEASEELAAVRARMREVRARLTRKLEALVQRHTMSEVVAEDYVTLRNNRFVIPVKSNFGQKLQGIVQDRSASGETLFLEPLFAVDLNNDLLLQAREEERIVRRILADLTAMVREHVGAIAATFDAVTAFDVLAAKAGFAARHRCTQPELSEGDIDLRRARHPILLFNERPVVPIDIALPADKSALVITGPNTGGKTVALKTLGLLSLMAQSGLLLPVDEGSRLPCWTGVFADVGDEQNIQRNLSTFSAHIANLIDIERALEPPALVLLDEPGVGTDPEEGASLAIGLLQTLPSRRVRVVATTHYTPVKLYALTQDRCVVAAVDFDLATLAPRYRLLYHSLGESLALPIAEQLGLPARVLEAARAALSEQTRTVNAALARLEESRRGYEERRVDVESREAALAARERESHTLLEELQAQKRERWRGEIEAARQFVRDLKSEGRGVLAELRAAERAFGAAPRRGAEAEASQALESFVERAMEAVERRTAESGGATEMAESTEPVHVGDQVEIAGGGFRGELLSISGDKAWIRRGSMRVEVRAAQLRRIADAGGPASETIGHALAGVREQPALPEITLIGLRAREALARLEEALDRAALAGYPSMRVVHGKGSGALRRAVQEYLQLSPYCSRYRDGAAEEGGSGVTIVDL